MAVDITRLDLTDLDAIKAAIEQMPESQKEALHEQLEDTLRRVWLPQPGPQLDAFRSVADETLYGGAAGGGKTDLLVGLSLTQHLKSVIFRAQSTDLDDFWARLAEVASDMATTNNSQKKILKTRDGRVVEGGHLSDPGSEKSWQGRPHDFIGFDEAAQLDEMRVEFVCRWLRSTTKGQRQRVMFATNPPLPEIRDGKLIDTGVGDWLLRWFAPWVDERYPYPAKPGEIRWCYMTRQGDRLVTTWVPGPGCYRDGEIEPVQFETPEARQAALDAGQVIVAKSRTFIRSLLKDNAFLKGTGYAEKMSSTPEPLKSMLLLGDFTVKVEDNPMQVIPTQWVLEAQQRWEERQMDPETHKLPMLVLFGDIAQGGADSTVLAPLHLTDYFGELTVKPGRDTPDGPSVVRHLLDRRRNNALMGLDGTGGWAGDTYRTLELQHNITPELVVSSSTDGCGWTEDGMYRFGNVRTDMWWGFRLALDPKSNYDVCLPPDPRLRAQLTAPVWYARGKKMYIESKEELAKRLNSSTDEADAVIGAWHLRELAFIQNNIVENPPDIIEVLNGRAPDGSGGSEEMENPLKGW